MRVLNRTARLVGRSIVHTSVGERIPDRLKDRVRRRVIGLTTADVVAISHALDENDVPHLLAGGWGIDSLVGCQTRPHIDVDAVVLDTEDTLRRALTALAPLGYELVDQEADGGAWMPVTLVLRDRAGHLVELLPVEELPTAVRGSLDGTAVDCLAPDVQLRFHSGYRPRASD